MRLPRILLAPGALLVAGACAPRTPPPAPPPPVQAPDAGSELSRVREALQVTPWELVFSGVRGSAGGAETVSARNLLDRMVDVQAIAVVGEESALFRLRDLPELPAHVLPKKQVSVTVAFAAPADTAPGVHRAVVRFQTGATIDDGPTVDLAALVTDGKGGEHEPPLQRIGEALGYSVDVGGPKLKLGLGAASLGDEVVVPLFERAKPGPVALNPVARFSAEGPLAFGHYPATAPKGARGAELETLGTLGADQHQTVNPEFEGEGQASFEPSDGPFGVWVRLGKAAVRYSEDGRNSAAAKHAVRVYPMRTRGGDRVPDAFLLAFDEGTDGDFQDVVFVLWNVKPASAAAAEPVTTAVPAEKPAATSGAKASEKKRDEKKRDEKVRDEKRREGPAGPDLRKDAAITP
jgi:hypothetical protein